MVHNPSGAAALSPENDPRNVWIRLLKALDHARAGEFRAAEALFDAVKYSPVLTPDLLAIYRRELHACRGPDRPAAPEPHRINSPADYLMDPDPRLARPLRIFSHDRRVPEPFPPALVLPPHPGPGNAVQFLQEAAAAFAADTDTATRRVLVLYAPSGMAALAQLMQDVAGQEFGGQIRLAVFAAHAETRIAPPDVLKSRGIKTDIFGFDLQSDKAAETLAQILPGADLVIFLSGTVRLDPTAIARADHLARGSDMVVQPLVPVAASGGMSTVFTEAGAAKKIGNRYPFRDMMGLNLAVPGPLLMRVGMPDRRFATLFMAARELAFRLYNRGAYFAPLQVPALEDFGQQDQSPPEDRQLYVGLCPNHWDRKRDGRFDTPKVSIYIPAYNARKYLGQAINSVLAQDFQDLEICIADDGSRDGTAEFLAKTYAREPRVRWETGPNGGIGHGSNRAIRMARGLYIGQLDSDDMLKRGAVRQLVSYLDDHPETVCAYSSCERVNSSGAYLQDEYSWRLFSREKMMITSITHHFRMFRRAAWERTTGFREDIVNAVDYDMFLKLSETGGFYHLDRKLYQRRWHGENTSMVNEAFQTSNGYRVQREALVRQGLAPFWDVHVPDPAQPRRVTYRRKPDKRLVLVWPYYHKSNPYQKLLYSPAAQEIEFGAGDIDMALQLVRQPDIGPVSFHLHWLNFLLRDETSLTRAQRLVDEFIAKLEAFKAAGGHLVWTIHNTVSHDGEFEEIEIGLSRRIAELADVLHFHAASSVAEVARVFPVPTEKVRISAHGHYIGIYPDFVSREAARATLDIAPDDDVILFSGQVRPYKGIEQLVTAFRDILPTRPRALLLITGEDKSDILQTLERPLNAAERARIRVPGRFIETGEMQLFARAADVAVYPYRHILTSGSLLMALSFGLPVVIPDVGMTREVLSNTMAGRLYGGATGQASLGGALMSVLADKDAGRLPEMQRAARAVAEAMPWPNVARTLFGPQQ